MSRQSLPKLESPSGSRYIHDERVVLDCLAAYSKPPTQRDLNRILDRALRLEPMQLEEVAQLIRSLGDVSLFGRVINAADSLRRRGFGNSVKVYVPLYISNYCANNCSYCSFRRNNRLLVRRLLNVDEFLQQINYLLAIGHRNIEVVLGYDRRVTSGATLAPFIEPLRERLDALDGGTIIVMTEPMDVEDYSELQAAGATEVYSWQETYHRQTYSELHPEGTHKALFDWRTQIFDRVLAGGIPRIGMGFMLGLYNWDYEELSLAVHALWLRNTYSIDPYAFGVPRFKPAEGVPMKESPYSVSDDMYRFSVAIRRLVFPHTHTYMNTRENFNFLIDLLASGGTEINAEASTVPGGYTEHAEGNKQFFHYSFNSPDVFEQLKRSGYAPTFGEITPSFK